MIINHPDGKVTDTNKLNDISALIMEKSKELCDLCIKYKIPLFLKYIDNTTTPKTASGAFNSNNDKETYIDLLECINQWFKENGDQFRIVIKDWEN
jgi:hypothetical protein